VTLYNLAKMSISLADEETPNFFADFAFLTGY